MQPITRAVAHHVLWHYGANGGLEPGVFTKLLMRTIDHADKPNTELLRGAYPALVAAMFLAGNSPTGIATLQTIAAGGQVAA
ncbi:hypothetical protein [Streptomyces hydrogenans]